MKLFKYDCFIRFMVADKGSMIINDRGSVPRRRSLSGRSKCNGDSALAEACPASAGGRGWVYYYLWGVAPKPSYFLYLDIKKVTKERSRLQIILGLLFFVLPTQYNS